MAEPSLKPVDDTPPLRLVEVDPESAADEALNVPEPDPLGLSVEQVARRLRVLRMLRIDRDDTAARFDTELARVKAGRDRFVGQLDDRIADVEATLCAWFEAHRGNEAASGRRPPKSMPFPDGTLKSRVVKRVEHDLDELGIAGLPGWLTRTKTDFDKNAAKTAAVDDEGRVVDHKTGEVFPICVVETVSYTIDTQT